MTKVSFTILRKPDGEIEVLACSDNASVCIEAFEKCDEPGEVQYIRKVAYDKRKVNQRNVAKKKVAKKKVAKKKVVRED